MCISSKYDAILTDVIIKDMLLLEYICLTLLQIILPKNQRSTGLCTIYYNHLISMKTSQLAGT